MKTLKRQQLHLQLGCVVIIAMGSPLTATSNANIVQSGNDVVKKIKKD